MSFDPLIKHAIDRVWCSPSQDYQAIFKVARLTGFNGARWHWGMLMVDIDLPDTSNYYHLFQLGQIVPELIALFPDYLAFPHEQVWTSLLETANDNNTILDVYFDNGVKIPLSECWFTVTDERALILAVKDIPPIGKLVPSSKSSILMGSSDVFLRIYKNAFFNSDRRKAEDRVYYRSTLITSSTQLSDLQNEYEQCLLKKGKTQVFRNGFLTHTLNRSVFSVGDWVEFVHDTSVKQVISLKLSDLSTFRSSLDGVEKYLIHPNKLIGKDETIDFQDDVDVYLTHSRVITPTSGTPYTVEEGIYYHKNSPMALRNVTHRDFSTPVFLVSAFQVANKATVLPLADFKINLLIRESGYNRPLVNEGNRIKELYKLNDGKILEAMVGLHSTVNFWGASALEASAYTSLMGKEKTELITREEVTRAYGYDAVVDILAKPIHQTKIDNSQIVVSVPNAYLENSTGFEYDQNGHLLGTSFHEGGILYNCVHPQVKYVEFIRGELSTSADDHFDEQGMILDSQFDWALYIYPKNANYQSAAWEDITGDTNKYHIESSTKRLTWLCMNTHHVLARSNANTVTFTKTFNLTNGLIGFNVMLDRVVNGRITTEPSVVPFGEMDVWLNKRLLIEGLDYHVVWPHIAIVNKSYLVASGDQTVIFRGKGFCRKDHGRQDTNEFGFIQNGRLSVDKEYDVRMDKALRISVDGGVRLREELKFVEQDNAFEMVSNFNGNPYSLRDAVVELKDHTGISTYELRRTSLAVDKAVGDYLTENGFGKEVPSTVSAIPDRHRLYSPFLSSIISDLFTGLLNPDYITGQYSNNQVSESVRTYTYMLKYDPIHPDNKPDLDYAVIDPHCWFNFVTLPIHKYLFLQRVVMIFSPGVVSLNDHIRVA